MILHEKVETTKVYFYTGTVEHQIAYRKDALTKNQVIINYARAHRPHSINPRHQYDVAKLIKKSEKNCIFCKYENNSIPLASKEKRYKKGENVIFQNLYPFASKHYVAILTKHHFVRAFNQKHFQDLFENYILLHKENHPSFYAYINMNFLPPSGASIIHPHAQIIASRNPSPFHKTLIQGFKKYTKKAWIEEHKIRGLLIKKLNHFYVMASFAPRLNKEIAIVSTSSKRLLNTSSKSLQELATILKNIINHFLSQNIFSSFNFALYEHEVHGIIVFVGLRNDFHLAYSSDRGFMEVYHDTTVISHYPEKVAKEMKEVI